MTKLLVSSGKSTAARSRPFNCLFYPQNSKTIFSVGKFDNCSVFILQTMTRLNVAITYIHANLLKDVTNFLLKDIVSNKRLYSNRLQHVPPRVLSIFPTLTLGRHNPFYQLTIHILDNSHVCLQFFRLC